MSRPAGRSGGEILGQRALNRATLERQLLLRRHRLSIPEALEHLVGLQAQAANPPYIGLWTRLEAFAFEDLSGLLTARKVVRCALMRGTLHMVTARDVFRLRPVLQPILDRGLQAAYGRQLTGLDLGDVAAATRDLLAEQALTYAALGKALQQLWPDRDAEALAAAARNCETLVQAPPALWGGGSLSKVSTAKRWLKTSPNADAAPGPVVLRYLAAFGPASVADIRTWCGLPGLADVIAALQPRLRRFRSESGVELFDLPDAPRPDPDTPAPVRLLPGFDNLVLSYADRSRVLAEAHRGRIFTNNGIVRPMVLVDGCIGGTWKVEAGKSGTRLEIAPFGPLTKTQRIELVNEAAALLEAVAPEAKAHDVHFNFSA